MRGTMLYLAQWACMSVADHSVTRPPDATGRNTSLPSGTCDHISQVNRQSEAEIISFNIMTTGKTESSLTLCGYVYDGLSMCAYVCLCTCMPVCFPSKALGCWPCTRDDYIQSSFGSFVALTQRDLFAFIHTAAHTILIRLLFIISHSEILGDELWNLIRRASLVLLI